MGHQSPWRRLAFFLPRLLPMLTSVEFYRRVPSFLVCSVALATSSIPDLTPCSSDVAREVCGESTRFRQARKPFQPTCGRLARFARRCTPRPSKEQCALTFLGTIAFNLHTLWRTALFLLPSVVPTVAFATVFSIFPVFLA